MNRDREIFELKRFKGTKTRSPYQQLYHWLARLKFSGVRERLKGGELMTPGAVWLNPVTAAHLTEKEKGWHRKRNKAISRRSFDYSFAMYWLNASPAEDKNVDADEIEIDVKSFWSPSKEYHRE